MTDSKHSPTPWTAEGGNIVAVDDSGVCAVSNPLNKSRLGSTPDIETALANAALIVEAVNSHARLLAEREELLVTSAALALEREANVRLRNDREKLLDALYRASVSLITHKGAFEGSLETLGAEGVMLVQTIVSNADAALLQRIGEAK